MMPAFETRGPSSLPSSKRATRCRKLSVSFAMSRALVTPLARSSAPSTSLKCWWLSHSPGIRKRPCASMISASADGFRSASGAMRTMRSPRTRTLVPGVTLRSRGSNRRALRITRSPFGVWASACAMRSDQCVVGFLLSRFAIAPSLLRIGSGTTENQDDTDAAVCRRRDRARSIAAKSRDR